MSSKQPQSGSRQRIDKWLFFSRMAKSRSIAQSHVQSGHVRVNGVRISQTSHPIKPGDRVELSVERRDMILIVKAAGERRGPYEEARLLYEDLTPPPDPVQKLTAFEQAQRLPGAGRPTKKERREIDRLHSNRDFDEN